MKNIIIIITISAILAFLSLAEGLVVKNFSDDMKLSVSATMEKIKSDSVNESDISKIEDIWEKYKTAVFIFVNHNAFKEYEDCISEMQYHYKSSENSKLYYKAYKLYEINKRMEGSMKFNIGNIF